MTSDIVTNRERCRRRRFLHFWHKVLIFHAFCDIIDAVKGGAVILNPSIKRMASGGLSRVEDFALTADEIKQVVDWYNDHAWTKIDENDRSTFPPMMTHVQLCISCSGGSVVREGYLDVRRQFQYSYSGNTTVKVTHWRPMADLPRIE